jgi:hypothetical protein
MSDVAARTAIDRRKRRLAAAASVPPTSRLVRYSPRFRESLLSGAVAGLISLALYYVTLPLLPSLRLSMHPRWGKALFFNRYDLTQFFGTFVDPPYPHPITWVIGLCLFFGLFIAAGLVYALLLSWTLRPSTAWRGIGFGVGLFFVVVTMVSFAYGIHPAVMRYAIPDPGLLLLGWSGWAALQLLVVFVVFGGIAGALYRGGRV